MIKGVFSEKKFGIYEEITRINTVVLCTTKNVGWV